MEKLIKKNRREKKKVKNLLQQNWNLQQIEAEKCECFRNTSETSQQKSAFNKTRLMHFRNASEAEAYAS